MRLFGQKSCTFQVRPEAGVYIFVLDMILERYLAYSYSIIFYQLKRSLASIKAVKVSRICLKDLVDCRVRNPLIVTQQTNGIELG